MGGLNPDAAGVAAVKMGKETKPAAMALVPRRGISSHGYDAMAVLDRLALPERHGRRERDLSQFL